ncbi:MAG: hypothetical protein ACREIC_01625, partial [Limisphaerales bacterium]
FVVWGYRGLNGSVRREAEYWKYAKENWGAWSPEIVGPPNKQFQFRYNGDVVVDCNVPFLERKPKLVEFHRLLQEDAAQPTRTSWLFKPLAWLGDRKGRDREVAQRALLTEWILQPLVSRTRLKMREGASLAADASGAAERQKEALSALKQLESDALARKNGKGTKLDYDASERYLKAFLSFLTGLDIRPDRELVEVVARTFGEKVGATAWPPDELLTSTTEKSLDNLHATALQSQTDLREGGAKAQ